MMKKFLKNYLFLLLVFIVGFSSLTIVKAMEGVTSEDAIEENKEQESIVTVINEGEVLMEVPQEEGPYTVTVHIYDNRSGEYLETVSPLVVSSDASQYTRKDLYEIFTGTGLKKAADYFYTDSDGATYTFAGWYDTEGNLIGEDSTYLGTSPYVGILSTLRANPVTNTRYPFRIFVQANSNITKNEEITIYANWDVERPIVDHNLTINFYDVKPEGTTLVKVWSDVINTISHSKKLWLNDIFPEGDSSRVYSGVLNRVSNTESYGRYLYTFAGYYIENTDLVTSNYEVSGDMANGLTSLVTFIPEGGEYETGFKYTTKNGSMSDVVINVYVHWDVFEYPLLNHIRTDNVSTGSGSGANDDLCYPEYHYTFANPEDKTPMEHYNFLYWQFDDEDEYTDDTHEYAAGDVFVYDMTKRDSGWEGTIHSYAWWQPSVTLNLYKEVGSVNIDNTLSHQESFTSVSINVVPTKAGYTFDGWVDENGNKVTDTTFYAPGKTRDEIEYIVNLFATWKRTTETKTISKTWDDNENVDNARPDSVTVELYSINKATGTRTLIDTYTLNENGGWKQDVTIYPYDELGNPITYELVEKEVKSYTTIYSDFTVINTIKEKGRVIVKYIDKDSEEDIKDMLILFGVIDQEYSVQALEIEDYTLEDTIGNSSGVYTDEDITIIYVYNKNMGTIVIRYVDMDDNELAPTETLSGKIGSNYYTDELEIPGYTLEKVIGSKTGVIKAGTTEVIYVYNLNVGYSDEDITVEPVDKDTTESDIVLPPKTGYEVNNYSVIYSIINIISIIGISYIFKKREHYEM